jgi:hypothetical protein
LGEWQTTHHKTSACYEMLHRTLVIGSCKHDMNLDVLYNVGNFLTSLVTLSFSRRSLLHPCSWLVGYKESPMHVAFLYFGI